MTTTNDSIFKSLAALEQNLKDINSAKDQVIKVVKSSDGLADSLEKYKSSFDGVSKNLQSVLKEIKSINIDTISSLSKQIDLLKNEAQKLSNIDYEKSFNLLHKDITKQFEKDLRNSLEILDKKFYDLQDKIDLLRTQIVRLEAIDLKAHFSLIADDMTKKHEILKVQHETLIKETKTNRMILIGGTLIIIVLSIINLITK